MLFVVACERSPLNHTHQVCVVTSVASAEIAKQTSFLFPGEILPFTPLDIAWLGSRFYQLLLLNMQTQFRIRWGGPYELGPTTELPQTVRKVPGRFSSKPEISKHADGFLWCSDFGSFRSVTSYARMKPDKRWRRRQRRSNSVRRAFLLFPQESLIVCLGHCQPGSWVATVKLEFSLLTGWKFINSSPHHQPCDLRVLGGTLRPAGEPQLCILDEPQSHE